MKPGVHGAGLGMALAVGLMLAWPRAGSAQAETMPPPDRARLSPPVRAAIAQFERIVAKRDLAALERHVEPGAKMSFGGGTLREVWKPERPDTGLWRELEDILRLGGVETVDDVSGTREWGAPYTAWTAFGTDADGE